jgi:hypothetical protein
VGGIIAYEAGKAIIHSASTPFNVDGRPYYWGEEHYKSRQGFDMCKMPLENLIATTTAATTTTTTSSTSSNTTVVTTTVAPTPDQLLAKVSFSHQIR